MDMSQPLVLGKRIEGKHESMPLIYLKGNESVIGACYEIEIKLGESLPLTIRDGTDKQVVSSTLLVEMPKKVEGFKINWIQVGDDAVRMQVAGSPFAWSIVLAYLPEILAVIGLTVTAIGVYLVTAYVPKWVGGLLLVGGTLVLVGLAPRYIPILKTFMGKYT